MLLKLLSFLDIIEIHGYDKIYSGNRSSNSNTPNGSAWKYLKSYTVQQRDQHPWLYWELFMLNTCLNRGPYRHINGLNKMAAIVLPFFKCIVERKLLYVHSHFITFCVGLSVQKAIIGSGNGYVWIRRQAITTDPRKTKISDAIWRH